MSAYIKRFTGGAPTASAVSLMASYMELTVGTGVSGIPARRFTLVFPIDTDRTPTVIALTDGAYSIPNNSTYKYRVEGGADQYNLYEMVYDPANDTVDIFVNGVERISDYPGNNVASANSTRVA